MNLLLDSTALIDLLRKDRKTIRMIEAAVESGDVLYTSAINVGEVFAGIRHGEEMATESVLKDVTCVAVSSRLARRGGELKNALARRGKTHSLTDMIVAATALDLDLELVTSNLKDFPVDGLRFWPRTVK